MSGLCLWPRSGLNTLWGGLVWCWSNEVFRVVYCIADMIPLNRRRKVEPCRLQEIFSVSFCFAVDYSPQTYSIRLTIIAKAMLMIEVPLPPSSSRSCRPPPRGARLIQDACERFGSSTHLRLKIWFIAMSFRSPSETSHPFLSISVIVQHVIVQLFHRRSHHS